MPLCLASGRKRLNSSPYLLVDIWIIATNMYLKPNAICKSAQQHENRPKQRQPSHYVYKYIAHIYTSLFVLANLFSHSHFYVTHLFFNLVSLICVSAYHSPSPCIPWNPAAWIINEKPPPLHPFTSFPLRQDFLRCRGETYRRLDVQGLKFIGEGAADVGLICAEGFWGNKAG